MSNALAIATVTQALALLLENNLRPEIDMAVSVETRRPPADPPTEPTITVFLYQVTPNVSLRNSDLPTRASDGTLLKRPAAPLDLHFLISAFGEETELVGQRLLGTVIRTLHEIPVLPRELIEEAARRPYLAGSDLADAIQKVRFTPTQMDIDETSKLWGMLHQTPYVLSVCYQAALVLVEGREKPIPAKPVERPDVHVHPFGSPGAPEPSAVVRAPERGAQVAGGAGASDPAEGAAGAATARGSGGDEDKAAGRAKADGAGQDGKPREDAERGRAAGASTRAARKAAAGVGGAGTRAAKKPPAGRAQRKAAKSAPGSPRSGAGDAAPSPARETDTGTGSGSGSGKEG